MSKKSLYLTLLLSIALPSIEAIGGCIKIPGWFINPSPARFGRNAGPADIARSLRREAIIHSQMAYASWHYDYMLKRKHDWEVLRKNVEIARAERREKYKAEQKALAEEKERKALEKIETENAKYRVFTGKNGATLDAKVIAISPLIKKAKLKSREGNTFEIALANFSNQDVEYLKSWGVN